MLHIKSSLKSQKNNVTRKSHARNEKDNLKQHSFNPTRIKILMKMHVNFCSASLQWFVLKMKITEIKTDTLSVEMNFNSNSESCISCLKNIPQDFSSDKGKLWQTNTLANERPGEWLTLRNSLKTSKSFQSKGT